MRSRKVYQIYSALPETDRQAFGDFLRSPYFGFSSRLADFQELIELKMLGPEAKDLDVEEVWHLLPDTQTAFRANGFDKLCSELLAALNDFLVVQEFRQKPKAQAPFLLRAYLERGLDDWIPQLFESQKQALGQELEEDADGFLAALQLEDGYSEYVFRQPRAPLGDQLLRWDARLNAFYLAKKLELATSVDTYNRSFSANLVLPHLQALESMLQVEADALPLCIRTNNLAWKLSSSQEDQYYFQLKALLLEQGSLFSQAQLRQLFHIALNFCTLRLNAGDLSYESEMDSLQMEMLERELIQVNGKMPPEQFKNIVRMRLSLGELKWVERFIAKWGHAFTNDHGGCALIYNKAALHFHQGNYSECVRGMETVLRDFKDDVFYGLDARIYVLMSLFEQGKTEDMQLELDSRLNAFRIYLLREKRIGEGRKARYENLVKQFRRLVSLSLEDPEKRRQKAAKFIQVLNSMQPAANRKWFERQVAAWLQTN